MRKKLLSMLALLCLTVSGAWAQEETLLTTIESTSNDDFQGGGSRTFDNIATVTFSGFAPNDGDEWGWYSDEGCTLTVTAAEGYTITRVKFYTYSGSAFDEEAPFEAILDDENITKVNGTSIGRWGVTKIEVYGYAGTPAPTVVENNITIGVIKYKLYSDNTAQVGDNYSYSGALTIPKTVEYNSETYTVTSIGNDAFFYSGLTSITIPNTVTSISGGAFNGCTGLTSITIPNSVTSIGGYAFAGTGLTSVTIGSGVTSIDGCAFQYCPSLTSVTIYAANAPSLGGDAFADCPSGLKTYVFSDCTDDYSSKGWPGVTAISVTANSDGAGNNWATYYNEFANVQMPEGTQVFKVALEGTGITLTEISDRIVNAGQGVVLKSGSASIELASATSESATSYSGNSLLGTMTEITNPGNAYVLNKGTQGAGFYKLKSTGTIDVNKAYLKYSGGAGAREFFLFDEATGIEMPTVEDNADADAVVYDLQGRRVVNPTKGLYIVNGKKVFINK